MERPLESYDFLRRLKELPFVEAIWLFGSRARGYARERSDIDLAILCPTADIRQWDRVRQIVEEEADTLLEIDVVRLDELHPEDNAFRAEVLRTGRLLFRREPRAA